MGQEGLAAQQGGRALAPGGKAAGFGGKLLCLLEGGHGSRPAVIVCPGLPWIHDTHFLMDGHSSIPPWESCRRVPYHFSSSHPSIAWA